MAANPTVFLRDSHSADQVLVGLLADRNPDVRRAVVEHFTKVRNIDPQTVALILKALIAFYEDLAPGLIGRFCSPETYANLNDSRIASILPSFIAFTDSVTNWRHMRDGIRAITSFPTGVLQANWRPLARIVFGWVKQYTHALSNPCCEFCNIVAADLPMFECESFTEFLVSEFASSPSFRARAFVPTLCGAFAAAGGPIPFIEALFRHFPDLSIDPVLDVRVTLLRNLPKIRRFFALRRDGVHERETVALFNAIGERDRAPHIRATWHDLVDQFRSPLTIQATQVVYQSRSLSTGLPKLVVCGSKAPQIVTESESGGQNLFRRIRANGLLPMPSVFTRQKLKGFGAEDAGGLL
jgi:hypothetical protein